MTLTQKIILIALLVIGGVCVIVGFTLMHYIGGFLRTVEEEAQQSSDDPPETDPASGPQARTDPNQNV